MKEYILKARSLALSATAKDTYILFIGNVFLAFWGFLFTLIIARAISVSDFGIFSATLNLAFILSSLADIGISSGSVNFVSESLARGDIKKSSEYIKASFVVRIIIVLALSVLVLAFAPFISARFLASQDSGMGIWAAVLPIFLFPEAFFPFILRGQKRFLNSTIMSNSFYIARLLFAFFLYITGALTIPGAFWGFGVGFLVTVVLAVVYIKTSFLFAKPGKVEYKNLLKFSGWIGVNGIISSIAGRLDILMLAAMAGAVATGVYSIPSRLATFIIVLAGSFSSVLATRLAGFGDKTKEKSYILKSALVLVPITVGIIIWIIMAKPFVTVLFGAKYLEAVPVFQALAASQIPFLFTVPAVSAIIYAMKKTIYIGGFSFFQLAAIFLLNYYFIPKYGPFGPTITVGIVNTILAIYVWTIVVRHYWLEK